MDGRRAFRVYEGRLKIKTYLQISAFSKILNIVYPDTVFTEFEDADLGGSSEC